MKRMGGNTAGGFKIGTIKEYLKLIDILLQKVHASDPSASRETYNQIKLITLSVDGTKLAPTVSYSFQGANSNRVTGTTTNDTIASTYNTSLAISSITSDDKQDETTAEALDSVTAENRVFILASLLALGTKHSKFLLYSDSVKNESGATVHQSTFDCIMMLQGLGLIPIMVKTDGASWNGLGCEYLQKNAGLYLPSKGDNMSSGEQSIGVSSNASIFQGDSWKSLYLYAPVTMWFVDWAHLFKALDNARFKDGYMVYDKKIDKFVALDFNIVKKCLTKYDKVTGRFNSEPINWGRNLSRCEKPSLKLAVYPAAENCSNKMRRLLSKASAYFQKLLTSDKDNEMTDEDRDCFNKFIAIVKAYDDEQKICNDIFDRGNGWNIELENQLAHAHIHPDYINVEKNKGMEIIKMLRSLPRWYREKAKHLKRHGFSNVSNGISEITLNNLDLTCHGKASSLVFIQKFIPGMETCLASSNSDDIEQFINKCKADASPFTEANCLIAEGKLNESFLDTFANYISNDLSSMTISQNNDSIRTKQAALKSNVSGVDDIKYNIKKTNQHKVKECNTICKHRTSLYIRQSSVSNLIECMNQIHRGKFQLADC
jgi:hypothetical protein